MSKPDIIHFAGDINVEKINILSYGNVTYSVLNQLISIQIFEDLFSPFITGVLTFKDSLDFMNGLPMLGQELLDLSIYTPTLKDKGGHIKGQFYINEIKNREFAGDRNVIYELSFISKEALVDANVKLSRGYSGKVSELVNNVLTDQAVKFDTVKKINIEPTKNDVTYVSNFWSPTRNMDYLCENALNQNGHPSYVFFENRDGFNFGSLQTLSVSPTITQEFKYDSSTQRIDKTGSSSRDVNLDYGRITLFSLKQGFNALRRLSSGMLASVAISADITSKQYRVKTFDYFKDFDGKVKLNAFPILKNENVHPISYTAKMFTQRPKQYGNFTDKGDVSNYEFLQKRVSEIMQGDDYKLEINVPGRTDYTVGQVVRITTFQIEPLTRSESNRAQLDMIFSGRYLISSINHFITRESHQCSLELIKDSYISSFSK